MRVEHLRMNKGNASKEGAFVVRDEEQEDVVNTEGGLAPGGGPGECGSL